MEEARKKLLVVEDDELIRVLIRLYLVRMPFDFYEAKDGAAAFGLARSIDPDLIITDLTMPRMDGITLIKALRSSDKGQLQTVPIIALTSASNEVQAGALQAGADTVLEKPLLHDELRQSVRVYLRKSR